MIATILLPRGGRLWCDTVDDVRAWFSPRRGPAYLGAPWHCWCVIEVIGESPPSCTTSTPNQ